VTARTWRLGNVVGEIVLVATSILLAFALDAGWARFTKQSELRGATVALRADLADVRAELDRAESTHEEEGAALSALLRLMDPTPAAWNRDPLTSLGPAIRITSTDPPQGVIASILSGQVLSGRKVGSFRVHLWNYRSFSRKFWYGALLSNWNRKCKWSKSGWRDDRK